VLNKSIIDSSVLFFKAYLTFQSEESLIEGKFLNKSEGKIMLTYDDERFGLGRYGGKYRKIKTTK
jgi:hypothetical protein